jgi:hypothetical protein
MALAVLGGGRAEAQTYRVGQFISSRPFLGPGGPVTLSTGSPLTPASATFATTYGYSSSYSGGIPGYIPPYSYYAAIPPAPARIYVDYADSGFNFYGRPYGHPYDRWSWSAMGSDQGLLNRYYYPPVR